MKPFSTVVLACTLIHFACSSVNSDEASMSELVQRYADRLDRLSTLTVSYHFVVDYAPGDEDMKLEGTSLGNGFILIAKGQAIGSGEFWRNGDQWRFAYTVDTLAGTDNPLGFSSFISSRSTSRFEQLMISHGAEETPTGRISESSVLPVDQYLDVGLGLRFLGQATWWSKDNLPSTLQTSRIVSANSMQSIDRKGVVTTLTFDPDAQYAVVKYEVSSPDGRSIAAGTFENMRTVDEVSIPTSINWQFFHPDGSLYRMYDLHINDLSLSGKDEFLIEWPLNAAVIDERSGASFRIKSAPQVITDEVINTSTSDFGLRYPHLLNEEYQVAPTPISQGGMSRFLINLNAFALVVAGCVLFFWRKRSSQPQ